MSDSTVSEYPLTKTIMKSAFRPIFLIAGVFSLVSMIIWFAMLFLKQDMALSAMLPVSWHAHEMLFGYVLAVVTGYLVLAPNILGGSRVSYKVWMYLLTLTWFIPRVLPFVNFDLALIWMFVIDLIFGAWLLGVSFIKPITGAGWQRWGISILIALVVAANLAYYLGLLGIFHNGELLGLSFGLYFLLMLVMLLSEIAVPILKSEINKPSKASVRADMGIDWLFLSMLILIFIVSVADSLMTNTLPLAIVSGLTGLLLIVKAIYRIAKGDSKNLLNWAMITAYIFIALGFVFKSADALNPVLTRQAVHAFAIGGIGILTMLLMASMSPRKARISSSKFSFSVFLIFGAISGATIIYVLAPLWLAPKYLLISAASQLGWIVSAILFLMIYTSTMLSKKRRSKSRSNRQ